MKEKDKIDGHFWSTLDGLLLLIRYTKQKGGQPTGEENQLNILTTFKDICKQLRPYMCTYLEFELRAQNSELRAPNFQLGRNDARNARRGRGL